MKTIGLACIIFFVWCPMWGSLAWFLSGSVVVGALVGLVCVLQWCGLLVIYAKKGFK